METGKHFEKNQERLQSVTDKQWAGALEKCREHIKLRIKRRTTFGAHTESRLGEDPYEYYLTNAYDAILSGRWEWKGDHTLSQQLIFIIDSTISTEVEKFETNPLKPNIQFDDVVVKLYDQDGVPGELGLPREALVNKQIAVVEQAIIGDDDLSNFWECVKEGYKRADIAAFLEKTPKQIDKLRERFVNKIKNSPYFEMT